MATEVVREQQEKNRLRVADCQRGSRLTVFLAAVGGGVSLLCALQGGAAVLVGMMPGTERPSFAVASCVTAVVTIIGTFVTRILFRSLIQRVEDD